MWAEIVCGFIAFRVLRRFFFQTDELEIETYDSNALFAAASRLEQIYGGKIFVGLRIPDADTGLRQSIDMVLVTKGEAVVICVKNLSGFVSMSADGSWICEGDDRQKSEILPDPVAETRRWASILESYLVQRGVALPEGYLSWKVLLPNPKFRTGHSNYFPSEVITYDQWIQLKPEPKSLFSGWIKSALRGGKKEMQESTDQKLNFVLNTAPMWDRLELKGNHFVLGEFLEFKGKKEDMAAWREIKTVLERENATMVGLPYDFLVNPLGAVRSTFDKAISSGSNPACFDGKDWGAIEPFRHFLFDQDGLSKVPVLNASSVRLVQPNTLVRFRGMVQDMPGNEFYVGAYKDGSTWKTTKFTESSQCPTGISPDMRIWERRSLYCVPVPGQNSWTESSRLEEINHSAEGTSENRLKRDRLDENAVDHMDMLGPGNELLSSSRAKKMKNDQLSPSSQSAATSSISTVSNAERGFLPCLVKMYDTAESELKLNEVFEFIGVITLETEQKVDKDAYDEFANVLSEDSVQFPLDMVPRLHCIIHRKLAVHDFHTCHLLEPTTHQIKEIRTTLLNHLTVVLGNDGVAAHFLLLHLLSKVHARVDSLAVGKLSLNLTGFNRESMSIFGNQLRLTVKSLLPFTEYIPLTVEYLNTAPLAPKKDYEINRLVPGVLQLAEGSHLMIDETQLEIGTLSSHGVENARLLKSLMEMQKVEYDFKYYKMDMTTDVQLLILSEGKSNILPADLVVPFQPSSVGSSSITDVNTLEAWRWYLSNVRSLPHSIETEMHQVVENDLVAAKQADKSLGCQDLSRLLTLGRLMSASNGETSLSLEHWQMVKEIERLRRERLT